MASELSKRAAEEIRDRYKRSVREYSGFPDAAAIIDSHGVLVSHEDAALLEQLRRIPENREVRLSRFTCKAGEFWYVTLVTQREEKIANQGIGLSAILGETLDHAKVHPLNAVQP